MIRIMKHWILIAAFFIGFIGCQKPKEIIYSDGGGTPTTRSITQNVSPVFDWWDTTSVALPGVDIPVTLPWYNGSSTQIPYYMLDDYKPEDGWEMVYNYCIDTPPGEINKNYIIFYNKFRGILRVYYYNNNDVIAANQTFWKFEVIGSTSLFNALGQIALPMSERVNNPAVYVTNLTNLPSKAIARGWNCFDIELAYDDQLPQNNTYFNIGLYNIVNGEIKLDGDIELETEGTIVTHTSSSPGWIGDASKAVGDGAKTYVGKRLEKTSLEDDIVDYITGGVSALVSGGARFFLGALIGKKDNSYNSTVQLTTTGDVSLTGEFQALTTSNALPLANNLMPGCIPASDDSFLPSYDEPLGMWNVEELPMIYPSSKVLWTFSTEYGSYDTGTPRDYYYHGEQIYYFRPEDLKIKINPDVLESISRYTVDIRCIYKYERANPEEYDASFSGATRRDINGVKGSRERYYSTEDSIVLVMDSPIPKSRIEMSVTPGLEDPDIPSIRGFIVGSPTFWAPLTEEEFTEMKVWGMTEPPHNPYMLQGGPYAEDDFFYHITLTLYPKAPYNSTPIVSMRTYKAEIDRNGEPGFEMPYWELRLR